MTIATPGRARAAVATLATLVLLTSACSSSKPGATGNTGGSSITKPARNDKLLGTSNPASGTPIKIGYINDGQSQGVDARPEVAAAQAAVKYVNAYLGGVAGRPVELVTCATNLTPAGGTDCANQMIAAKVPVALSAAPSQPAAILKGLAAAKIPYFAYAGIDQSMLLSPDAYVLTNPLGTLAVPIKVAKDAGVKKVAMVLINLPAAVGPIKSIAPQFFNHSGLSVSFIPVAPGTPDMTPQIQGALSSGAQQFTVIGDSAFCISALGALKTLGFSGNVVINSQCFSKDLAGSVSGGVDGVQIATNESLDPKDPEVALYEAVMAKYAPSVPPHMGGNSNGFAAVVGFVRALKGFTGDLTPDTVRTTLASAPPQPLPLLGGQTFTCNHKVYPLTPAVCSTGAAIITLDASGKAKSTVAFDASPYLELG